MLPGKLHLRNHRDPFCHILWVLVHSHVKPKFMYKGETSSHVVDDMSWDMFLWSDLENLRFHYMLWNY